MDLIIKNLYLGDFTDVLNIKENPDGFAACLSVGKEFFLLDVEELEYEDINNITIGTAIKIPNLNLIGIKHKNLPFGDGNPSVICNFLTEAIQFIC